jgi:hypothetical protein
MYTLSLAAALLFLGAAVALPRSSDGVYRSSFSPYRRTIHSRDQADVLAELLATKPTQASPTYADDLHLRLSNIWGSNTSGASTDFYSGIKSQISSDIGVPYSLTADVDVLVGPYESIGSTDNINPRSPSYSIYPSAENSTDPDFTISEAQLRAAIQIPSSFTYGQRPPVILVPGTGGYGGENFQSNIIKALSGSTVGDAVWLNIPGAQLDDAQRNSEYVAYAVNYISGISGDKNVSLISWSQGGLDIQWAFTFWPSIRSKVSDFVPVSPDFHGTTLAKVLCLSAGAGTTDLDPCPPSVIQQEYNSVFVSTLRAAGGADAYVPTTTLYSGFFDEIVEPQQGVIASAFIGDARGVGATNVEAQTICFGRVAAGFYGHAGMLYHPLTIALVIDALSHEGPGDLGRLDLNEVCSNYVAPELTVADAVDTAAQIVTAAIRLLAYQPRLTEEPTLMPYAMAVSERL